MTDGIHRLSVIFVYFQYLKAIKDALKNNQNSNQLKDVYLKYKYESLR